MLGAKIYRAYQMTIAGLRGRLSRFRDRILEAAQYIPVAQLGTNDDCGFGPFSDDTSTSRDPAFAKIGARVQGTALAADAIGGG